MAAIQSSQVVLVLHFTSLTNAKAWCRCEYFVCQVSVWVLAIWMGRQGISWIGNMHIAVGFVPTFISHAFTQWDVKIISLM